MFVPADSVTKKSDRWGFPSALSNTSSVYEIIKKGMNGIIILR